MSLLKFSNGDVLVDNFPVGKRNLLIVGFTLDFKEKPDFRKEKTPDWYKAVSGRKFKILDVVVKYKWLNGGMSIGLNSDIEYIVEEVTK